jgi:hypothetical protein
MIPMLAEKQRKDLDKEIVRCWGLISKGIELSKAVAERFDAILQ